MGINMHEITSGARVDILGTFKNIGYELGKQGSFNRKVTLFALAASCYIFLSEKRNREREVRIDKLEKEIASLKNQKG